MKKKYNKIIQIEVRALVACKLVGTYIVACCMCNALGSFISFEK